MPLQSKSVVYILMALALNACASGPEPAPLDESSGSQLYQGLCSSCHGPTARGDGPIAPLIKIGVPDLTLLSQRNGGTFPTDAVRRTIDGRYESYAHGARDMPVWGWRLYDGAATNDPAARARTDATIANLVEYLQSLQR
ncbi:MAG: cytochrome c [Steroidobacteraceae bacterium]